MRKLASWPWWWIGVGVYWLLIFLLARFPPSEPELLLRYAALSKFSGITLPANFAAELPFPLPAAVLSLVTWQIPLNMFLFRAINLLLAAVWLFLVWKLTGKYTGSWIPVLAGTSLWLLWTLMSSVPAVLTLLLVTGLVLTERMTGPKKPITQAFVGLWLTQTSLAGWIFAVVFLVYTLRDRFDRRILAAGIFITGYSFFTAVVPYYRVNIANTPVYIKPGLGQRVDQRVRHEFSLNDYRDVVPLLIKRLVYNKPFFAYRELAGQIISRFSPERLAFPGQEDATVARSLWGSKGLGWISWWLIPLVLWGLSGWKQMDKEYRKLTAMFALWGTGGLILGYSGDFLENGIGIAVTVLLISAWLLKHLDRKLTAAIGVIIIISTVPNLYHFLGHEEIWRDNRPPVQLAMARMGVRYRARQISTILGRSFLYFDWIDHIGPGALWNGIQAGQKLAGVKFDHFDLKNQSPVGGVYVGLPGEFLGNKAVDNNNAFLPSELPSGWVLLDTYHTHDTVSFGNGDFIWAVKVR